MGARSSIVSRRAEVLAGRFRPASVIVPNRIGHRTARKFASMFEAAVLFKWRWRTSSPARPKSFSAGGDVQAGALTPRMSLFLEAPGFFLLTTSAANKPPFYRD